MNRIEIIATFSALKELMDAGLYDAVNKILDKILKEVA